MSCYHYIGSGSKLPLGERGSVLSSKTYSEMRVSPEFKKQQAALRAKGMVPMEEIFDMSHLKDEDHLVYDTQEDAAGIYIEELSHWNSVIRKHFHSPYVYRISSNGGSFSISAKLQEMDLESYKASLKCCRELFKLMEDFGIESSDFELYTCWADEEDFPRNKKLDRVIDLSEFHLEVDFELLEKQYIVVRNCYQ